MDSLFNFDFSSMMPQFFYPFVRILALIMSAPILGERTVPNRVKIGLAAFIALIMPIPPVDKNMFVLSPIGVWIIIQQIIIGVAIGYTMQFAFMAARFSGELVGMQMGLTMATFYDPTAGQSAVLSRLFNFIALLIFLSLDGHLWVIYSLAESFNIIPISTIPLQANGYLSIMETSSLLFINGIMLALPLITLLMTTNIALGLLNRMTPQLSIFVVGFPTTLLLGLVMLVYLMPNFVPYCEYIFKQFFETISSMIMYFAYRQ